jgi:hypothetical protein
MDNGRQKSHRWTFVRWAGLKRGCVVAALWLSAVNCKGTGKSAPDVQVCTVLGCDDEFAASISLTSESVPAGTLMLTVTADGVVSSCSLAFPPPPSLGDAGIEPVCSGGLLAIVQNAGSCTTSEVDGAVTERCDATAGAFTELIRVFGMPAAVRVQQSVGGSVILDKSVMPTYLVNHPNGAGCDPTCHQAAVSWSI